MLQLFCAVQEIGGGEKKNNFVEKNNLRSRGKNVQDESN